MADLSYLFRDSRGNSINDYAPAVGSVIDFLGSSRLGNQKKASSAWEAPLVSENTNQRNYGDFIESLSGVSPWESPIPRGSRTPANVRSLASTPPEPDLATLPAEPQSPEQAIMAKLKGMQVSQIDSQKEALKKLEAEMEAQRAQGGETNLQPLTSLVDSWTGSNFTGSYKQPMSQEERKAKEFAMQDMLQKQRRGIADDEMGMLKIQLAEKLGVARANKPKNLPPPKQWEWETAGYGKRMADANKIFENLSNQGFDRSKFSVAADSWAPDMFKDETLLLQDQAERNFINATLRRESGATISKPEFATAEKQYFDRPGDTPRNKAQKAANRARVIENMRNMAGAAWQSGSPGGAFTGAGDSNEMVNVVAPDGTPGEIPRANLQQFLDAGGREE